VKVLGRANVCRLPEKLHNECGSAYYYLLKQFFIPLSPYQSDNNGSADDADLGGLTRIFITPSARLG
jgi:hypothetical protein